jgi:hypothetical protein
MYAYQIQGNRITIVVNNRPYTLAEGQLGYDDLRKAIKEKDWAKVPNLVSPKKVIVEYTNGGNITIQEGGVLCYKNVALNSGLTTRIMKMRKEGFDIQPMVNFLENVMLNPSTDSQTELFEFLDKNDLPITPDGHFLAYKKVRQDYKDCHSGKISNKVGDKPSMSRESVDADRRNECSVGLHFCSYSYLKNFGGDRVMILKINPADVVSIPNDYDRAKGRCWQYEVIGEVEVEAAQEKDCLAKGPVINASASDILDTLTGRELYQIARFLDPNCSTFGQQSDNRFRDKKVAVEKLRRLYTVTDLIKATKEALGK